MSRVEVRIDRLILRGIDARDRAGIAEGLVAELTRLLADPAKRAEWAHSQRTPVMRPAPIAIQPGPTGAGKLGSSVARAIARGLTPLGKNR
jgi:hypothetical protein